MKQATLLLVSLVSLGAAKLPLDVVTPTGYTKLRSWANCSLYRIEADTTYDHAPLLIHLPGSRYDIGYGYGYLLADEIAENYQSLMKNLLGDKWYDEVLMEAVGLALDWQWKDYLSKQLPEEYKTELRGLADGGKAAGCSECGNYANRAVVLANAPGDLKDFAYILMREFDESLLVRWGERSPHPEQPHGMQCSMFAVWGSRTEGGSLYSARNLDWNKDTGVNKHKVVMIVVPNDGGIPSATLGFTCLYGTLAGMSAKEYTSTSVEVVAQEMAQDDSQGAIEVDLFMEKEGELLQQVLNASASEGKPEVED